MLSVTLLFGCAQILGFEDDQLAPSTGGSSNGDAGSGSSGAPRSNGGDATEPGAGTSGGEPDGVGNGAGGDRNPVTGSGAGGAANPPECSAPDDCPGQDSECATRTCTDGVCGFDYERAGKVLSDQTANDCKRATCDGHGAIVDEPDDSDLADGGNVCMVDSCKDGTPTHDPAPPTTSCGSNNQFECDGQGACAGCTKSSDCGLDNLCATYTCTGNTCQNNFVPSGQGNLANTAGDCKKNVCDGMGSPVAIADDSDLPEDNNPCTKNVCSNGAPSHPNESATKSCGTYSTCNGSGSCVCNDPAANACPRLGAQCGTVTNGCGQSVSCTNTCSGVDTCNGGGDPNACGCTPKAFNCGGLQCAGTISDGCGHTKDCSASCQSVCPDNCQTKICMPSGASGSCYCSDCNG
jgi:hypothetical protein